MQENSVRAKAKCLDQPIIYMLCRKIDCIRHTPMCNIRVNQADAVAIENAKNNN